MVFMLFILLKALFIFVLAVSYVISPFIVETYTDLFKLLISYICEPNNFFSSSEVNLINFSLKYLFIESDGSSKFIAAFKDILPSFINIISSNISPSYTKNSFFFEIKGIKFVNTSAINSELSFFLKNLKFFITDLYIVNNIVFFKVKGKASINEFTSYFSWELLLLSKYLYIFLYNLKGIFGYAIRIFSKIFKSLLKAIFACESFLI